MSPEQSATPSIAARMAAPAKGVKVRMYRTGLGDCFLLAFPKIPTEKDPREVFYLLIDCGVYFRTPEPDNATRIRTIVRHIAAATGGVLDLLVITHEHWDHISAFHPSQAQSIFKEIDLRGLWMAWTENPDNPLAKDLHEGRKAACATLANALSRMNGLKSQGLAAATDTCALVGNLLDFFGGQGEEDPPGAGLGAAATPAAVTVAGGAPPGRKRSVRTEEAMLWIRETYGQGKAQFLHPGEGPIELGGVPDARIYVLGPPEDPALIRKYNPSASGDEVYPKALAAAIEASFFAAFGVVPKNADALPGSDDVKEAQYMSLPFDEMHQTPMKKAKENPFFNRYLESDSWRRIDGDWMEAASEFALQLDCATNNTSLAFALEIGPPGSGKVLLFPGDAQVGNWLSWFGKVQIGKRELGKEMVWTAETGNGSGVKITAEDLLHRTVFYKVSHHGSHNATPRDKGLGLMGRFRGTSDLVAFLPVDEHVARDLAHYGEMPLRSLVKDLAIRTNGRVARNDAGKPPTDETSTLARIPGAPALRLDFLDAEDDLYFEYTVAPPG